MLSKRKMTGTWIQNNIHTAFGHPVSWSACNPCVFADFETDANTIAVENQIAHGPGMTVCLKFADRLRRPCAKPAWLIMQSISCKVLLGDKSRDATMRQDAGCIVNSIGDEQRQPNRHDHAIGFRNDLLQHVPGCSPDMRCQEHVFAAITWNTQLRQTQDVYIFLPCELDRFQNAVGVAFPIERRLIQSRRTKSKPFHV